MTGDSTRSSRTLGAVLDPRRNSLNAIRLALALMVMVSHTWPLNGWSWEPSLGGLELGGWAVMGFFAVSGYLITRSRLSGRGAADYAWARALRILPAFVVCLVLVAFVFAPLASLWAGRGGWDPVSASTYVLRNLPLSPPYLQQLTIGTTLDGVPFAAWDGPLWTLCWEALCYVAIGFGVALVPRRALAPVLIASYVAGTGVLLGHSLGVVAIPWFIAGAAPALVTFAAGSALFLLRDRIVVRPWLVPACLAALVLVSAVGAARSLAPLPLAILVMVLGARQGLHRVGSRYDVSYGIYIYGWPVQQLIVVVAGPRLPVPTALGIALVVTLALAWLSCRFIEQPAMRVRSRYPERGRGGPRRATPAGPLLPTPGAP